MAIIGGRKMRSRKILAAVMAAAIVFGSFAALPEKKAKNFGAVTAGAQTFDKEGTSGDFKYGVVEDGYVSGLFITGYTGSEEVLRIPETLKADGKDMPVKGIATGAFANNTTLRSVTITPSIWEIEGGAFEKCTALQSVKFELAENNAQLTVRPMAFAGCTALSNVTFDPDVKGEVGYYWLDEFSFIDCTALKQVTVPRYVGMSNYSPVFGYHQTESGEYPSFTKDADGKIITNLEKNDEFMMNCYMHSGAAQNAFYCGLLIDYVDGPYDNSTINEYVSEANKNNADYNISMADTGFTGTRVNNFEGYADCITNYYADPESLISGYASIGAHRVVDTENKEPLLEFGTVFPYSFFDASMEDGIVSINCYGQGLILNEYEYFMDLVPNDGYIIPKDKLDAARNSAMPYKTAFPRFCDINGNNKFTHNYGAATAMRNGYVFLCSNATDGSAVIADKNGKTVLKLPQSFEYATFPGKTSGSTLYTQTSFTMGSEIEEGYGKGLIPYSSRFRHDGKTIFDADCEKEGFDGWYTDQIDDFKNCGYIDLKGNIVIPQQFSAAGTFTEDGLAWAGTAEYPSKYGYIDTKGNTVIPFEYSYASDFDNGYAVVRKNGKYGMIDKNGKTVVPFEYEDTKGSKGGLMTAEKAGKWGMVDCKGNTVIPFVFEDVSLFGKNKAFAVSENKVYRFDITSAKADYVFGDVNGDGVVDIEDAVKVIAHINGISALTADEEVRADATFNGDVDIEDAVCIISQVNGNSIIAPPDSMKQ